MPPSKPRQKRKRELGTDADIAQGGSGSDGRNGSDDEGVTQKRPRRSGKEDAANSGRNNGGSLHDRREVYTGLENGSSVVGRGASINNRQSATGASSSSTQPPRSSTQRSDIVATATSGRKSTSGSRHMRRLAQDTNENDTNVQSEGRYRRGATSTAAVTPEKTTCNTNDDASSRDQIVLLNNNNTSHSTTENGDNQSQSNLANVNDGTRRKLKLMLLFSVVSNIIFMFLIFPAVIYNCKVDSLETKAMNISSTTHKQSAETINAIELKTPHGNHIEDSQETIMRLQNELAHVTSAHEKQMKEYAQLASSCALNQLPNFGGGF